MAQPFLALPKNFRDLLLRLPTASEEEAAKITIQLQKYLQDEDELRNADPDWGLKQAQRIGKASAKDRAEEQYTRRGDAWVDEIVQQAQNKLPNKDQVDRLRAKGAKEFQEMRKIIRGDRASRNLWLDQAIANSGTEEIMVSGQWVQRGESEPVIVPDVVRIRHRTFVLEPGTQKVPGIVAQVYRDIQNGRAEARARAAVLKGPREGSLYDAGEIEQKWDEIDSKYGTERVRFQGG